MAGRNEGCASIGCLGLVVLFIVAMCTGGSGGGSGGINPQAYPPPAPAPSPPEPREWLYIHGTMNVRAAPNKGAPVVRTLSRGDMVQLGPRQANGWARIYTGAAEDEYVYRASDLVRADPPALTLPPPVATDERPRRHGGRQLHRGPRGGCYYINGNGNKTYVDRSECD